MNCVTQLCDRASKVQLLLQALLSPSAQCKRDGEWKEIEARELVPGDLIQLKGGDVIPADAKVTIPPISKPFPCMTNNNPSWSALQSTSTGSVC